MQIYDITQNISNGMPVWPGDPKVELAWLSQLSNGDDVNLTEIRMCAHTGTHIDMPSHFLENGRDLNDLDLSVMIGLARVVEVPPEVTVINEEFLKRIALEGVERLLFKTSNSQLLLREGQDFSEHYVALDFSGASFLAASDCKLVGIDYLSIATYDDPAGAHLPLLEEGIVVLEGINLKDVEPGDYQLIALPLRLDGREGSPVRAVLLTEC